MHAYLIGHLNYKPHLCDVKRDRRVTHVILRVTVRRHVWRACTNHQCSTTPGPVMISVQTRAEQESAWLAQSHILSSANLGDYASHNSDAFLFFCFLNEFSPLRSVRTVISLFSQSTMLTQMTSLVVTYVERYLRMTRRTSIASLSAFA